MIDWLNPSDDIIEARRVGYNEGYETAYHEVESEISALKEQVMSDRLMQALKLLKFGYSGTPKEVCPHAVNMVIEAFDAIRRPDSSCTCGEGYDPDCPTVVHHNPGDLCSYCGQPATTKNWHDRPSCDEHRGLG